MDNSIYTKKKQILVISSEPQVLAEIKSELMEHFEVSMAATSEAALTSMTAYKTSAVVICHGDNHNNAFDVFAAIFETAKSKNIPIIFLAEKGNDYDETAAFEKGAVDYSVRRRGTIQALIGRINLRVRASEYEQRILRDECFDDPSNESILYGKTILVADDVELNRDIIECMLSDIEGLTLEFALDGKEVIEKFSDNPELYSLILMDVQMPVMNGLEATRMIRNLIFKKAREIPIIALTAGTNENERSLCLKAGMNDFVEKPIDFNSLFAAITEHCL